MIPMDLQSALADLPIGAIRFYDRIGSTNDEALSWADQGAPDFSLVVANEQTRGRGRKGRRWHTPPDAALAFSVVLKPGTSSECDFSPRLTALGSLAIIDGFKTLIGLAGQIKWPNDVLLEGRKVAGVLAEAAWLDARLETYILGIGINVAPQAVPPTGQLSFPATSVETVHGEPVNRWALLRAILQAIHDRRSTVHSPGFLKEWEANLAYRGVPVRIEGAENPPFEGVLKGLQDQGHLVLIGPDGALRTFTAGEITLRLKAIPGNASE